MSGRTRGWGTLMGRKRSKGKARRSRKSRQHRPGLLGWTGSKLQKVALAVLGALGAGVIVTLTNIGSGASHSLFNHIHQASPLSIQVAESPGFHCAGSVGTGDGTGGTGWVFPKQPDALPLPGTTILDPQSWDAWVKSNGGVPASGNVVELTLQPVNTGTVIIQSLTVRVLHRSPPLRGTHVVINGIHCLGAVPQSNFKADLDSDPVSMQHIEGTDSNGKSIGPVNLPHEVTANNPELIRVTGDTFSNTCKWDIVVRWTMGRSSGTVTEGPFFASPTVGSTIVSPSNSSPPRWVNQLG
jgi:hypothetical protein